MPETRPRVAVVGGGIGGLTLAIALCDLGIPVDVFEQASEFHEVGAAVALAANGTRLLNRLGLAEGLAAASSEFTALVFRRWDSSDLIWSRPLGQTYRAGAGAPFYGIHRRDLQRTLVDHVPPDVLHLGRRVVDVDQQPDGVTVQFADGSTFEADIVVGADGIHSMLRRHVDPEDAPAVFSGDVGFRGLIPVQNIPSLPEPGALQFWVGPGAHVLHYPIHPGGDVVNFLAVVSRATWDEPTWRSPCDLAEAVAAFGGWHPAVIEMVSAVTDETAWWALHDRLPLARWNADRLVLLGDAAHAMLPHQGQGANTAIEDAVTLAHCLAETAPQNVTTAVRRYERLRCGRTRNIQRYSRLAAPCLHVADGPAAQRRDADLTGLDERLAWIHHYDAGQPVTTNAVSVIS